MLLTTLYFVSAVFFVWGSGYVFSYAMKLHDYKEAGVALYVSFSVFALAIGIVTFLALINRVKRVKTNNRINFPAGE